MKLPCLFRILHIKLGLLACCGLALAADDGRQGYRDYAPVVNAEPIMETSYEPVARQICVEPDEFTPDAHQAAPTVGEDIRRQMRRSQTENACETIIEQERRQRITGYWVTYRYRGRTARTRLSYDPGPRIPVDVGLTPLP